MPDDDPNRTPPTHRCPVCGREHHAPTYRCHACRAAAYRATPNGRARQNAANRRYEAKNPEKRRQWVHNYQQRIGQRVPDLQELRRAINRLEAAVEGTGQRAPVRGPDEPGSDDGAAG